MNALALFRMGWLVTTSGAHAKLSQDDVLNAIRRHHAGDWGDVNPESRLENEFSLHKGLRIWSVYHDSKGVRFWIITEADRSVTTILLPEDY